MTTMIDWSQLQSKISSYKDLYDCENESMALAYVVLEHELNLSPEEIGDAITDGSMDRGVDAVFVDESGERPTIHLFQFKYKSKFEDAQNNFPSNEIDKLLAFVGDLLQKKPELEQNCNSVLWEKVQEIWGVFEQGNVPDFVVHLCGNMAELVPMEYDRLHGSLAPYRNFEIRQHTLETIVSMIIERKRRRIDGKIRLVDKQYFERGDGNIRGLIATVEASELTNLIRDPHDLLKVQLDIFDDNVRVYLTRKNEINQKIYKSALEQSSEFWYLNNGITITCDTFEYPPGTRSPFLNMTNVQIVNGGQTSNALFEAFKADPEKFADVLVLVRVYETRQREISQKIAESTNSQTPIRSRDLHSNDDVQKKLEDEFASLGYFYERKTAQHKEKDKAKRVDALTAGQAYLAYYLELPEVAKKDRGRIFGNLYDEVFSPDTVNAKRLLTPLKAFAVIDAKKRSLQTALRRGERVRKSPLFLIDGNYHVLYTAALLCKERKLDVSDPAVAIRQIDDAITVVGDTVQKEMKLNPVFRHTQFFKDADTKTKIQQTALDFVTSRP